ncbi:MAG: hypothetical protein AB1611_00975 [bacterium]
MYTAFIPCVCGEMNLLVPVLMEPARNHRAKALENVPRQPFVISSLSNEQFMAERLSRHAGKNEWRPAGYEWS